MNVCVIFVCVNLNTFQDNFCCILSPCIIWNADHGAANRDIQSRSRHTKKRIRKNDSLFYSLTIPNCQMRTTELITVRHCFSRTIKGGTYGGSPLFLKSCQKCRFLDFLGNRAAEAYWTYAAQRVVSEKFEGRYLWQLALILRWSPP